MASIATLAIDLTANIASLRTNMEQATKVLEGFQETAKRSSETVKKAFEVMGVAITLDAAKEFVKTSLEGIDALAKQADKLGITTQAMAGLQHAAALAEVGSDKLNISLVTMEKNLGDLYQGIGRSQNAFEALNLTADEMKGKSVDQQFKVIADRLTQVSDATTRANIAYKIFGESGVDILNMTMEGSKGLAEAAAEADKLGIAISRIDAAKVEMANDAFTRAHEAIRGVGNQIAIQLAPLLKVAADDFTHLIERNNAFRDDVIPTFESVAKAVGFVADVVRGLEAVFTGVEVVALGFGAAVLTAYDEVNKVIAAVTNTMIDKIRGPLLTILDTVGRFSDTAKEAAASLRAFQGVQPDNTISEWAENARKALMAAETQLTHLINDPMPSANVEAWFARVKAEAQKAAEVIAASKEKIAGSNGYDSTALDALVKSLRTQEQVISESYARRAEIVGYALQNRVITEQRADQLLMQLDKQYQFQHLQAEIQAQAGIMQARASAANAAEELLTIVGQHNKAAAFAALALSKGLAIAQVMANTQVAAAAALTIPGVGEARAAAIEAWGAGAIALIAATGLVQAASQGSLPKFAAGGVVDRSTALIAGEAGAEAIVPLPDGRSIPVQMRGGGGMTVQIYLQASAIDARGMQQVLMEQAPVIAAVVQQAYTRSGRTGGPYR